MEIIDYDIVRLPTWSIGFMFNGTIDNLSELDLQCVVGWCEEQNDHAKVIGADSWHIELMDEDPHWYSSQAFGEPSDSYETKIIFLKEETK